MRNGFLTAFGMTIVLVCQGEKDEGGFAAFIFFSLHLFVLVIPKERATEESVEFVKK